MNNYYNQSLVLLKLIFKSDMVQYIKLYMYMYTHCMRYTAPAVTLIHPLKRIYNVFDFTITIGV